jgi:hypothetical protein
MRVFFVITILNYCLMLLLLSDPQSQIPYGKLHSVRDQYVFFPPNRLGVIFHLAAIVILTLAGAWGLWQAFNSDVGPTFVVYLLPFLLSVLLIPFLIYRLNSLENSSYALERDSMRLRWGLRVETIPMIDVQWVRPAADLRGSFRLPRFRWPGSILGTLRLPGGDTEIEFLASQTSTLLVIATPKKFFAISPANQNDFLQAYQNLTELGSLAPPAPQSVYPTILITRLWQTRPARYLLLAGALLSLGVFLWVSVTIPNLGEIPLGFLPDGSPGAMVPGIRLMLLPVLNGIIFLVNLLLGLAYFRREETQSIAYLLWTTSAITSLLFLTSVYFILNVV